MFHARGSVAIRVGLLAAALGAAPLVADRVVLANGRVFEDVAATVKGETVVLEVGGGLLTLPIARVAAIEAGPSTLAEYRRRAEALRGNAAATAADWLALARWAHAQLCGFGAREAALEAAARAPDLPGLDALMRELGYEQAEPGATWFPYEQAMRQRGWVADGDEWVPAAVAEERARARREEQRRAADAARLDRLTALAEARLAAELARPEPDSWQEWPSWGYPVWGYPIAVPQPGPPGRGPDRLPAPVPAPLPVPRAQGQSTTNSIQLRPGGAGPVPLRP